MTTGAGEIPSTATYVWENSEPTASYLVIFNAADLDIPTESGPGGITVIEAFPPDISQNETRLFARVPEMVAVFEKLFGPYPFSSIGNTVFEDTSFNAALETQGMIGYDASAVNERTPLRAVTMSPFARAASSVNTASHPRLTSRMSGIAWRSSISSSDTTRN